MDMDTEFDPVSADFNQMVAQGSVNLKFWRRMLIEILNMAAREHDERWKGLPPLIARYDKAIQYAVGIETGKTPPPITINVKAARMGAKAQKTT